MADPTEDQLVNRYCLDPNTISGVSVHPDGSFVHWDDYERLRETLGCPRLTRYVVFPFEDAAGNEWGPSIEESAQGDWVRWDEVRELLNEAAPLLRRLAKHCEDCGGSGEIISGPNDEEAQSELCQQCKPIWGLIERIQPPPPVATPQTTVEEDDDVLF